MIGLKSDLLQINRKTGSFFDLLSLCGGYMRSLNFIGSFFINPYTMYVLKAHLATNLVRFVPSSS